MESAESEETRESHSLGSDSKDEYSPTLLLPSLEAGVSSIDLLRGREAIWILGPAAKKDSLEHSWEPTRWAKLLEEKKGNPDLLLKEIKGVLKHIGIPMDMGPHEHWTINLSDAKTLETLLKLLPYENLREDYELSLRTANLLRLIAKTLKGREGIWEEYRRDMLEGASKIIEPHHDKMFGRRNLAFLCIEMGSYREAGKLLDRALQDMRDEKVLCGKAMVLRRLGRKHESLNWFEEAADKNPKSPYLWRDMGDLLLDLGRTEDAIECFKKAVELRPTWGEVWEVMGYAQEEAGSEEESRECLQRASKLLPSVDRREEWMIYHAALVGEEESAPPISGAEHSFEEAKPEEERERLDVERKELENMRRELESREREIASKFKELRDLELEIVQEGLEKEKVCDLLSRVASLDKENVLAFWRKGYTTIATYKGASIEELMEAGNVERSSAKRIKELLERGPEMGEEGPDDEQKLMEDAMGYLEEGELENALDALNIITKNNPENEEAWFNKAEIFTSLGKTREALNCYERALELNPKNQRAWIEKANLLMQEGFPVEAINCLRRFIELDPKNASYLRERAEVYAYAGDFGNAILCYNTILQINPEDVDALIGLGDAMLELSDVEEAEKCLQKAIRLDPSNERAWCKRAHILNKKGRWGAAIQLYNRSIALRWNYAEPWMGKAEIHLRQGNYQDAMDSYDKATRINSSDPRAWFGKGLALEKLLVLDKATRCFRKALKLDGDFYEAEEALKRIEDVEGRKP
ncbi:MAG: tetratricopeptide repeat protein [Thermoplasmata archaeon]